MNFTLIVTQQELQILSNALAQRPYAEVSQFLWNLQKQITEQEEKAKVAAATENPADTEAVVPAAQNGHRKRKVEAVKAV